MTIALIVAIVFAGIMLAGGTVWLISNKAQLSFGSVAAYIVGGFMFWLGLLGGTVSLVVHIGIEIFS
jgi:hypothetical protein